jgi:citronellol/citronellal dehydrogenase
VLSVADEIQAAGGQALPIVCDAREESQLIVAVEQTVAKWGRIDLLVNNAGFLGVTPLAQTETKNTI